VLKCHTIKNKEVEAKKHVSKEDMVKARDKQSQRMANDDMGGGFSGRGRGGGRKLDTDIFTSAYIETV
jgi:hypothetical protein